MSNKNNLANSRADVVLVNSLGTSSNQNHRIIRIYLSGLTTIFGEEGSITDVDKSVALEDKRSHSLTNEEGVLDVCITVDKAKNHYMNVSTLGSMCVCIVHTFSLHGLHAVSFNTLSGCG